MYHLADIRSQKRSIGVTLRHVATVDSDNELNEIAHSHRYVGFFIVTSRHIVTYKDQFIIAFMLLYGRCVLLPGAKYNCVSVHRTSGDSDGIMFSIPTTSSVVAYNISRRINIPEGRSATPHRSVQSAGERTTRTTGAAAAIVDGLCVSTISLVV